MNNSFNNIIFLLGFPTLLISQSVSDSVINEIELFESKELNIQLVLDMMFLKEIHQTFLIQIVLINF